MRKHLNWLIGAGLMSAALAVGTMATTASAATARVGHQPASHVSAVRPHNRPFYTLHVTGTAWPSNGLNIRSGPGTQYSIIGTMPHNGTGTVFCYSDGTDIHGDPYWDAIMSNWGQGFVSDYYLYTGGNIYDQVDGC